MKIIRIIIRSIGIALLLILFAWALAIVVPGFIHAKGKAREAEVKSHLHTIQIGLEKYREEYGQYPAYLLGGDKEGWDYYNVHKPEGEPYLADPLIELGYFDSYPENPFAKGTPPRNDKKTIMEFRKRVRADGNDTFDPRFGLNGDKMGNALMEPYIFVEQIEEDLKGYPRMCPGQFYYRGYGGIKSMEGLEGNEIDSPDEDEPDFDGHYLLGAFGSIDNTGFDTIRWKDLDGNLPTEFPYISPDSYYQSSTGLTTDIDLRLPEVTGGGNDHFPLWRPPLDADFRDLLIGARDGSEDGVIITLRGGNWLDWEDN